MAMSSFSDGSHRRHCSASSWLFSPLQCVFKNEENARTIRQKSSQASGWHAKRPNMQFILCFTGRTGPPVQFARMFHPLLAGPKWLSGGPQEAFRRPPCSHALRRPTRGTHAQTHARTHTRTHACVLAVRSTSVWRVLHAGMLCSCCAALCPSTAPVRGPFRHGTCDYTALSTSCISSCSRRRMHPDATARPLGPQTHKGASLRSSRCSC